MFSHKHDWRTCDECAKVHEEGELAVSNALLTDTELARAEVERLQRKNAELVELNDELQSILNDQRTELNLVYRLKTALEASLSAITPRQRKSKSFAS